MFIKKEPLKLVSSKSMTMCRSDMYMRIAERYKLSEPAVVGEELKYLIIDRQEAALVYNKYMTAFVRQSFNYNNIIYSRFISNIVNRLYMLIGGSKELVYSNAANVPKKNKNSNISNINIKNIENYNAYKTAQIKNMLSGYDINNIFQSESYRKKEYSENSKHVPAAKAFIHSLEERTEKIKCQEQNMISNNVLSISRIYSYKTFTYLYNMSWKTAENIIGSKYSILINNQLKNIYYSNNFCDKVSWKYNNGVLSANRTKNIRYIKAVKYGKYHNNSKYINNNKSSKEFEHINKIVYGENAEYKNNKRYSNIYNLNVSNKAKYGYKYTFEGHAAIKKYIDKIINYRNSSYYKKSTSQYKDRPHNVEESGKYIFVTDRIMLYESINSKYGKMAADNKDKTGILENKKELNIEKIFGKSQVNCYFNNKHLVNLYVEGSINKKGENYTSEYKNLLMTGELFLKNIIKINKDVIERIKKKYKVSIKRAGKIIKNTYDTEMSYTAKQLKLRHICVIYNRLKSILKYTKNTKVYSTGRKTKPVENIRIYTAESMLKSVENIKGRYLVYLEGNILKHTENTQTYLTGSILKSAKYIKGTSLVYLEGNILKHTENIQTYWSGNILKSGKAINGSPLIYSEERILKHTKNIQTYWAGSILKSGKAISGSYLVCMEGNILSRTENIKVYFVGSMLSYTEKIKSNLTGILSKYTQNVQKHFQQSITENIFNKNQQNANREMTLNKEWHRLIYTGYGVHKEIKATQRVLNTENIQSTKTKQAKQGLQDMEDIQNTDRLQNIQGNIINRTENLEDILFEQEKIKEINKIIDVRVQSQVKNISRQVYETIERRLQGEKRRRGF